MGAAAPFMTSIIITLVPMSMFTPGSALQEADSVMADIRLQLARYAQGIHWVRKNFLLDEGISALLVTAGPADLPAAQLPAAAPAATSSHVVLQMQPDFDVPFPAPESWNQQVMHTPQKNHFVQSDYQHDAVAGHQAALPTPASLDQAAGSSILFCKRKTVNSGPHLTSILLGGR